MIFKSFVVLAFLALFAVGVACYQELLSIRFVLQGGCLEEARRVKVYRLALEKVTQQKFLKGDYVLEAARQLAREESVIYTESNKPRHIAK